MLLYAYIVIQNAKNVKTKQKKFLPFFKKIDIMPQMVYNRGMEKFTTIIIGGGASGLFLAASLKNQGRTLLLERGERLGRKLSATGNGQGNVTNLHVREGGYFSSEKTGAKRAQELVCRYDDKNLTAFFAALGVLLAADERGRVYPTGRQASALTDALRFAVEKCADVRLKQCVTKLERSKGGFVVTATDGESEYLYFAENVALCAGGKAAKNFGTDGGAYALAKSVGHSVTALYPSLVQLKTDVTYTKTLKGIRAADSLLTAKLPQGDVSMRGDVIFTDYGISGDAVFRISAYLAQELHKAQNGVALTLDFLPDVAEQDVLAAVRKKHAAYPDLDKQEWLFGIVNNQIGRAIMRRADGDETRAAALVKAFPLQANGSLGFDYAQVTKGGIPLSETDEHLQSRLCAGLYFTGEILDVDGACGGYNLQWAYASACTVAAAIAERRSGGDCGEENSRKNGEQNRVKNAKGRGQVCVQ